MQLTASEHEHVYSGKLADDLSEVAAASCVNTTPSIAARDVAELGAVGGERAAESGAGVRVARGHLDEVLAQQLDALGQERLERALVACCTCWRRDGSPGLAKPGQAPLAEPQTISPTASLRVPVR